MGDFRDAFKVARANRAKLDGCKRHMFDPMPVERSVFGANHNCIRCGGTLDTASLYQYISGYEARGGSCDDIYPGYRGDHAESVA